MKRVDQDTGMKGLWLATFESRAEGEAGTRMSGMLPLDNLIRDLINQLR